jgi:hypothetical protein
VLLQRDTDASQRSAKLALQTAASKKAREEASEMLAAARRLKQEAEEVREAGLQERRRASAEVLTLLHDWSRFSIALEHPFLGASAEVLILFHEWFRFSLLRNTLFLRDLEKAYLYSRHLICKFSSRRQQGSGLQRSLCGTGIRFVCSKFVMSPCKGPGNTPLHNCVFGTSDTGGREIT